MKNKVLTGVLVFLIFVNVALFGYTTAKQNARTSEDYYNFTVSTKYTADNLKSHIASNPESLGKRDKELMRAVVNMSHAYVLASKLNYLYDETSDALPDFIIDQPEIVAPYLPEIAQLFEQLTLGRERVQAFRRLREISIEIQTAP